MRESASKDNLGGKIMKPKVEVETVLGDLIDHHEDCTNDSTFYEGLSEEGETYV